MADDIQYGAVLTWAKVFFSRLCRLLPRLHHQLGNITPEIRVVLSIFVSGVTFEDGSLVKILTFADFDADGVCRYRPLQTPGATTSTCHTTRIYQSNVYVGGASL